MFLKIKVPLNLFGYFVQRKTLFWPGENIWLFTLGNHV